jgi:hypothetical protein
MVPREEFKPMGCCLEDDPRRRCLSGRRADRCVDVAGC